MLASPYIRKEETTTMPSCQFKACLISVLMASNLIAAQSSAIPRKRKELYSQRTTGSDSDAGRSGKKSYVPVDIGFYQRYALFTRERKVVAGLSLNIIGAIMDSAYGIQLSIGASTVESCFAGIQVTGFLNEVKKDVYGLSLSGILSMVEGGCFGLCVSQVNLLGRLYGVQASVFFNMIKRKGFGWQVGLGNAAEDLIGVQTGLANLADRGRFVVQVGVFNWSGSRFNGLQVGPVNWSVGATKGIQAGVLNVINRTMPVPRRLTRKIYRAEVDTDPFQGVQLSVMSNIANRVKGAQIAGFINSARGISGVQAAGFTNHVSGTLRGLQVGFFNYARRVIGVQVGVFNACRRLTGVQIGLLNIASGNKLPAMALMNMGF